MKFIEILLSFLTTQGSWLLQSGTSAVSRKMVDNARKIAVLLALSAIGIALFCSGFMMTYSNLIAGLEQQESLILKPGLIGGIILVALAISLLVYSLGEKRWIHAVEATGHAHSHSNGEPTLQTAAALLIVEIAQELKERRIHASKNPSETPQV